MPKNDPAVSFPVRGHRAAGATAGMIPTVAPSSGSAAVERRQTRHARGPGRRLAGEIPSRNAGAKSAGSRRGMFPAQPRDRSQRRCSLQRAIRVRWFRCRRRERGLTTAPASARMGTSSSHQVPWVAAFCVARFATAATARGELRSVLPVPRPCAARCASWCPHHALTTALVVVVPRFRKSPRCGRMAPTCLVASHGAPPHWPGGAPQPWRVPRFRGGHQAWVPSSP